MREVQAWNIHVGVVFFSLWQFPERGCHFTFVSLFRFILLLKLCLTFAGSRPPPSLNLKFRFTGKRFTGVNLTEASWYEMDVQ